MKELLWKNVLTVKEQSPLVQNITNYVVMNNTANALLAAGASPIMAHAHPEMDDMVSIIGALVINIGTLDEYWVESMKIAIAKAESLKKPWVLDPVGAGATPYRNEVLHQLIYDFTPTVIRGNASEIMSLAKVSAKTKGVDSMLQSNEALNAAVSLANTFNTVVCISGATDLIVSKENVVALKNGHPLMSKVTGMGCTATALIGAFLALNIDPFVATTSAMALMGVAGELAAEKAAGPGSFQTHFLDALYTITEEQFIQRLQVKEHAAAF
jgi:hydroxyethylthiazole kinase